MIFTLDKYLAPSTVQNQDGLWHPAIRHGLKTFYYPGETFTNEKAAAVCAQDILAQVELELNDSLGANATGILKELGT